MAGFTTLRDNFTDNSISASAWLSGTGGSATVAETGGQMRFTLPSSTAGTHYAELYTPVPYNLTSDSFYINIDTMVSTAVAATAYFDLRLTLGTGTANNMLRWRQVSNTVSARHVVGGTDTQVYSATWSGTTYKYLRIRADTTTVYWDSSSNGTSWTNRASVAISSLFAITDLFLVLGASCGNVATPGSFRLEDVNLILPALTTNWRYQWARWPLTNRHKRVTIAIDTADTAQGYLVTADGVDASGNPSGNVKYWSGPAKSGRVLTQQTTQAAAEDMAVNLPLNGSFDLPDQIDARYFRLYDRSIDGNAFTIREYFPRRLVQADDIEAESITAIHIGVINLDAAHQITAGGSVVALNDLGVSIVPTTTLKGERSYVWRDSSGSILGGTFMYYDPGSSERFLRLAAYDASGSGTESTEDSIVSIAANAVSGKTALISLTATVNGASGLVQLTNTDFTISNVNLSVSGGLNVGSATGATAGQMLATVNNATTAASDNILVLTHNSTGTPAANFGANLQFKLETSTTPDTDAALIQVVWTTATHASRSARLIFYANDSGAAREAFRIGANGSAATLSFFGAGVQAKATVTGSRGGNAALQSLLTALANYGLVTDSSSA